MLLYSNAANLTEEVFLWRCLASAQKLRSLPCLCLGREYFLKRLSGQTECCPGVLSARLYRRLTAGTKRPRKRPKGIRGAQCSGLEHKRRFSLFAQSLRREDGRDQFPDALRFLSPRRSLHSL